jgi:hypothetical protein
MDRASEAAKRREQEPEDTVDDFESEELDNLF